jgi:hypothetical protein
MFTLGSQEYNCIRGFIFVPLVLLGLGEEHLFIERGFGQKEKLISLLRGVY